MSTNSLSAQTKKWSQMVFRYHDLIPLFLISFMFIGFFLCWDPSTLQFAKEGSWRDILGKKLIIPLMNLLLLGYIIATKAGPSVAEALRTRHRKIQEGIVDFEERSDAIAEQYKDVRSRLQNVEQETNELLARAKLLADQEKEKTRAQATRLANKILQEAPLFAKQEHRRVQREYQHQLIEASYQKALQNVSSQIKPENHTSLQEEFLKELKGTRA